MAQAKMKEYNYCLKVTSNKKSHFISGSVTTFSFTDALRMCINTEGTSWEYKRSFIEVIYIIKVE